MGGWPLNTVSILASIHFRACRTRETTSSWPVLGKYHGPLQNYRASQLIPGHTEKYSDTQPLPLDAQATAHGRAYPASTRFASFPQKTCHRASQLPTFTSSSLFYTPTYPSPFLCAHRVLRIGVFAFSFFSPTIPVVLPLDFFLLSSGKKSRDLTTYLLTSLTCP